MNSASYSHDEPDPEEDREDRPTVPSHGENNSFKKLKRPMHAAKRSKVPERLRGMHRRRRKRMNW